MMLKHPSLKLSLATVLVASLPAAANAGQDGLSPLWFSLDLGAGKGLTQDDYQRQADDAGLDVTLSNDNTARLAWKAGAGWNLWQTPESPFTLATQVEWFDLGQVDVSYSGSVNQSQLENLYDDLKSIHPESGNGLALGLSGRWQGFQRDWLQALGLGAELGATYWWQTYELKGVEGEVVRTDETRGAGWYAGVTSDYAVSPQWAVRGGWRVYGLDTETAQTFSLGLTYTFNGRADTTPQAVTPTPEPQPAPERQTSPVGRPDQFSLDQAGTARFNVLANDSDPNGKPLRLVWVEGNPVGQVQITDDRQAVVYRHDGSDSANDGFRYWLSNGETEVGPVDVSLNIMRTRPQPRTDRFTVTAGVVAALDVLANDSDPNNSSLFISRINPPGHGRLELINDTLVYLVEEGSEVTETRFEYWVSNGQLEAGPVQVELVVD